MSQVIRFGVQRSATEEGESAEPPRGLWVGDWNSTRAPVSVAAAYCPGGETKWAQRKITNPNAPNFI